MSSEIEVLILENDLLVANEVEEVLRRAGFSNLHLGGNCQYALTWLKANTPVIAIVDPQLTDGRCREVFEILRERQVPFVVYSHDYLSTVERHHARGGQWVLKPAAKEVLARVIDVALASISHKKTSENIGRVIARS